MKFHVIINVGITCKIDSSQLSCFIQPLLQNVGEVY
jgi:hypothetical protein